MDTAEQLPSNQLVHAGTHGTLQRVGPKENRSPRTPLSCWWTRKQTQSNKYPVHFSVGPHKGRSTQTKHHRNCRTNSFAPIRKCRGHWKTPLQKLINLLVVNRGNGGTPEGAQLGVAPFIETLVSRRNQTRFHGGLAKESRESG